MHQPIILVWWGIYTLCDQKNKIIPWAKTILKINNHWRAVRKRSHFGISRRWVITQQCFLQVSSDPIHVISSDPTLEKPPDYSTVVDVPPCYEDAIKLSSTPIIFPLKHAPTSNIQVMSQNVEPIDTSSKNVATERNNSSQSDESCNSHDFAVPSVNSGQREKSEDVSSSQNSSQNENAFTKVFRKSIRGIRRLRSGSDDSSNSCGHSSNLENGSICQARGSTESTKVDR